MDDELDEADEEDALALRSSSVADEYERKYMAGEGAVLMRTKRPAPKWLQAVMGSMAFMGIGMLLTPAWLSGVLLIPLGIVMWALFSMLRFTVSEGVVRVQYGVFGPTIPTSAVVSAEAIDYDWKKFGGWGIRMSRDGEWMYNMPGDGGRAVRIVWQDAKGKRRVTNVGMPDPAPAVRAIAQAKAALPAGTTPPALTDGE
jgi:hypothetical protein